MLEEKMIKYNCPYCNGEIPLNAKPKFNTWRERLSYTAKWFKADMRHKECLICPNCKGELLRNHSKILKFNKDFYDLVNCSFCGKEINYNENYKEIGNPTLSHTFWCKGCLKKEKVRR